MAVVTILSDFGAQENKICHCFHFCGPWYGVKRGLLLFNMLSSFVKAFLPRSKRLDFMAAVIVRNDFGAQDNRICHCFTFSVSICHEVMGLDAMIFIF